jgi:pilus assembly protein Flp/PilA
MRTVKQIAGKFLRDESGATAVEYGLILATVAAVVIVVLFIFGNKVNNTLGGVAAKMP